MNKLKQSKAITLIALIITMIVLLILAGVVINMTLGNEGIIAKAQGSVDKYQNTQEKEEYMLGEAKELINNRSTITVDKEEYKQLLSDVSSLKQRVTNYDIIFNYDSTVANKCADKTGTFTLELGAGKTSVNDYKYLIVITQTSLYDTETSNIVYNFPDENITKKLYTDNTQYCNSAYYSSSYYYLIRYVFTDNTVKIGSIEKNGWSGAMIKKIVGVY